MSPEAGWTLAIDFGTSNTVVVVKDDDHGTRTVEFPDGKPYFPSGVYAADDGTLMSGLAAYNNRRIQPRRYFDGIKRAVTEGQTQIPMAKRMYSTADVVAAVLREAKRAAKEFRGDPSAEPARTALTRPVAWDDDQLAVLSQAAAVAELPSVAFFEEPVAAAFQLYHNAFPPYSTIAVYDLGGGTFDAALLERIGDQQPEPGKVLPAPFRVIDKAGNTRIGGEKFDDLIHDIIGRGDLADAPPWRDLQPEYAPEPADETYAQWLVDRRTLMDSIVDAKILLSRNPQAAIYIPGITIPYTLTLEVFEHELEPYLAATVDQLSDLVARNNRTTDQIAHVALVGGSSHIPMVRRLLVERGDFGEDRVGAGTSAQVVVAMGAAKLIDVRPVATAAENAFWLGEQLAEHNKVKEAAQAYRAAITAEDPQWSPRAAYRLGQLRTANPEKTLMKKSYEAAITAYRTATSYRDSEWSARAAYALAVLLMQNGRLDEAGVYLDNAMVANRPDVSPGAAYQLGLLHIRRGDWRSAEDAWQTAMDHCDSEWSAHAAFDLGADRRRRKNYPGATRAWQVAMGFGHPEWSACAAYQFGDLLGAQGRRPWKMTKDEHADAIGLAYRTAIASGHEEWAPRAAYALGRILEKRRDYKGAAAAYQTAIASGNPNWGAAAVKRKAEIIRHQ